MNSKIQNRIPFFSIFICLAVFLAAGGTALAALNDPVPENGETILKQKTLRQTGNYVLSIVGNDQIATEELMKAASTELQKFEERGLRKADIDDAAFQMRSMYLKAGFAFVNVDYVYRRREGAVDVVFEIEEGARVHIAGIQFNGNDQVDADTLLGFFPESSNGRSKKRGKVFVESEMRDAVGRILQFYRGEGFIDAEVSKPIPIFTQDRTFVDITIEINEGPRYVISEVVMSGDLLPELAPERENIKNDFTGRTYFVRRKLMLRTKLDEIYDSLGYAGAEFEIKTVKQENGGGVRLMVQVKSGKRIRIGTVSITGNAHTRESFIRDRLQLHPGDIYTNAKRRESFRNLYDSGLFSTISIELSGDEQDASRGLEVTVEELPTREYYLEPGWGSYEELRLRAGIFEKNLYGTGKNGRLDGLVSTKGETLTVSYTDPWLLHTDITMNVPLYFKRREEPSYTSEETGLSFLFSKRMNKNLTLSTGYRYKQTQLFSLADEEVLPKDEDDYNTGILGIQATWDTRDDVFYPAAGLRLAGGLDISLPALGSDLWFSRITLGCRYFIELPQEYILGLRATTGLIIPLGDQVSIPISERFFNGGDSTVRSYEHSQLGPKDENNEPIGGMGYNVFSVELRKILYRNFGVTLYVDAGNVSPNRSILEKGFMKYDSRSRLMDDTLNDFFSEFRFGIGVGLQYLLPVGPIRIDIAYNPDPEEMWQEDSWVYHFSLGMAF